MGVSTQIFNSCSAGPWRHGLHLPRFSADGQPCVYGDEREFPLAVLDETDTEAAANVVLLAAAWELCIELGELLDVLFETGLAQLPGGEAFEVRQKCNGALALLSRIRNDMGRSTAERYGEEQADEDD